MNELPKDEGQQTGSGQVINIQHIRELVSKMSHPDRAMYYRQSRLIKAAPALLRAFTGPVQNQPVLWRLEALDKLLEHWDRLAQDVDHGPEIYQLLFPDQSIDAAEQLYQQVKALAREGRIAVMQALEKKQLP